MDLRLHFRCRIIELLDEIHKYEFSSLRDLIENTLVLNLRIYRYLFRHGLEDIDPLVKSKIGNRYY